MYIPSRDGKCTELACYGVDAMNKDRALLASIERSAMSFGRSVVRRPLMLREASNPLRPTRVSRIDSDAFKCHQPTIVKAQQTREVVVCRVSLQNRATASISSRFSEDSLQNVNETELEKGGNELFLLVQLAD